MLNNKNIHKITTRLQRHDFKKILRKGEKLAIDIIQSFMYSRKVITYTLETTLPHRQHTGISGWPTPCPVSPVTFPVLQHTVGYIDMGRML